MHMRAEHTQTHTHSNQHLFSLQWSDSNWMPFGSKTYHVWSTDGCLVACGGSKELQSQTIQSITVYC